MTEQATATPAPAARGEQRGERGEETRGFRRKMVGRVVKDKMNKTVVVECVLKQQAALYGKYTKSRTRYHVHDEKNQYRVGDQVEIEEHRPISRTKRFIVTRLVKKFVEE